MQTFLPDINFKKSAQILDYRRLGKQRVEAKQILQCLLGEGSLRWRNHPAVKMWEGLEQQLAVYGYEMCMEWRARGYKDSLAPFFILKAREIVLRRGKDATPYTARFTESFCASHRAALKYKQPAYYNAFGWSEEAAINYLWPDSLRSSESLNLPLDKAA